MKTKTRFQQDARILQAVNFYDIHHIRHERFRALPFIGGNDHPQESKNSNMACSKNMEGVLRTFRLI